MMRRRPLLRMNLPQAILVAILIHLLLVLGGEVRPDLLPWGQEFPVPPPEPEPLRFEFVDLAQEPPEPETPPEDAPASDRTRRTATPEPPEPVPASPDPYSQGDTFQKMDLSPVPEIPPEQTPPAEKASEPPETPPALQEESPDPESGEPRTTEPVPRGPGERAPEGMEAEEARKAQAIRDAVRPFNLRELGQRYDNLAAPSNADFGPVSFDTVGVDWGPYAKRLVEIIRRHWVERLPPAFQAGLKGRSVLSFRIAKDGTVASIQLVDGSGVRPFDKAAEFAIGAASPLPPLPDEFSRLGKDDVGVTFEFYYNLRPPSR